MKTAISLPDELFAEAERLARRTKKTRSQLYAEAVKEYLVRRNPDAVTKAMNEVCAAIDSGPNPFVSAAAHRVLEEAEW